MCPAQHASGSLRRWRCCASVGLRTLACTAPTGLSRPSHCPHSTQRACSCLPRGGASSLNPGCLAPRLFLQLLMSKPCCFAACVCTCLHVHGCACVVASLTNANSWDALAHDMCMLLSSRGCCLEVCRYLKCVRTTATDGYPVLSYERHHGFLSYQQEYEVRRNGFGFAHVIVVSPSSGCWLEVHGGMCLIHR